MQFRTFGFNWTFNDVAGLKLVNRMITHQVPFELQKLPVDLAEF
jgi:hypothetical protein